MKFRFVFVCLPAIISYSNYFIKYFRYCYFAIIVFKLFIDPIIPNIKFLFIYTNCNDTTVLSLIYIIFYQYKLQLKEELKCKIATNWPNSMVFASFKRREFVPSKDCLIVGFVAIHGYL